MTDRDLNTRASICGRSDDERICAIALAFSDATPLRLSDGKILAAAPKNP